VSVQKWEGGNKGTKEGTTKVRKEERWKHRKEGSNKGSKERKKGIRNERIRNRKTESTKSQTLGRSEAGKTGKTEREGGVYIFRPSSLSILAARKAEGRKGGKKEGKK
jgi:hypothetical protein